MKPLWILIVLFLEQLAVPRSSAFQDFWAEAQWAEFKALHHKSYRSVEEEAFRRKIFLDNRYTIARHNERYGRGLVSFKLRMNQYGDLLQHEFEELMGGGIRLHPTFLGPQNTSTFLPPENLGPRMPPSVDWRKQLVSPIKDQGKCGSCWAFSAAAAIEGQHARKTGNLVELSAQDLLDCCGERYENSGCEGGLMDNAFRCVRDRGAIDTAESYPYKEKRGVCHFRNDSVGATVTGTVTVEKGDERMVEVAVATVGPVSGAVYAKLLSFRFYGGGVYRDDECGLHALTHAVLIVGYGVTDEGTKYWIVKNSWGRGWGEHGYMRLAKDAGNQCRIADLVSFPLV
ncbi:cathepsin L1-like [Amblyomma americanum]